MDAQDSKDTKKFFPQSRWGWLFVFVALFIAFSLWQIGEPGRRAKAVHRTIHPGMIPSEVLALLKGRYICKYLIEVDGELKSHTREEFLKIINPKSAETAPSGRLSLTFLGISPGRFSFQVEFGPDGKVKKTTRPHGWD